MTDRKTSIRPPDSETTVKMERVRFRETPLAKLLNSNAKRERGAGFVRAPDGGYTTLFVPPRVAIVGHAQSRTATKAELTVLCQLLTKKTCADIVFLEGGHGLSWKLSITPRGTQTFETVLAHLRSTYPSLLVEPLTQAPEKP